MELGEEEKKPKDTFPATFLQEREIIKKIPPHLNPLPLGERKKELIFPSHLMGEGGMRMRKEIS